MAKKYYWLKLQKDFFKRHDIRIIESMQNGKDYILFYLKLLVESVGHEGELRFSDTIPYSNEMLATITDTNIDIVRSALDIFKELKMIEVLDDATIYMAEIEKMIGSETEWAEKKRKFRKSNQLLTERTMSTQCPLNVRQEIEIDIEKDIEIDKKKKGCMKHPSVSDIEDYIKEKSYNVDAQQFYDYYESNGWKVGKNPMKDWKATVRGWNTRNASIKPKTTKNSMMQNDYNFDELERLANGVR